MATWIDAEMLRVTGTTIAEPQTAMGSLVRCSGPEVARELGGRPLIRYVTPAQVGRFDRGSTFATYVTPTPYSPEEATRFLLVPEPHIAREHAYLIDPGRVPFIHGPVWVAAGSGLQYILPDGFPEEAIIVPGAPTGCWAVSVR